jgi:predicted HAD superfamily Cof-like phosphohydrolase
MRESTALKAVREFHKLFEVPILDKPMIPPMERALLRISLIKEEFDELVGAAQDQDLVEVADALADLLYVVYGTALEYGIPVDAVFDEVHRSNMTKVWADGTVHRRDDGKILKPDTYSPADVKSILERKP